MGYDSPDKLYETIEGAAGDLSAYCKELEREIEDKDEEIAELEKKCKEKDDYINGNVRRETQGGAGSEGLDALRVVRQIPST